MNSQPQPIRQNHSVDPITLEVIRHGLVSITNQIDANISSARRSALHLRVQRLRRRPRRRRRRADRAVHRRHAAVRRRLGRHGGARWAAVYGTRPAAPRRRGAMQSRRGAGPASQQHGDVHADLRRRRFDYADRLFRHQRALDRHRRHHAALHRHFHGRLAAPLDQALVEGRADSRKSTASSRTTRAFRSSCSATSRRSTRAAFSAATSRKRWPTSTVSRPFSARSKPCSIRVKRRRGRVIRAMPDGDIQLRDVFRQRRRVGRSRCRSASKSSSPATK